jgi:hypothetical protein
MSFMGEVKWGKTFKFFEKSDDAKNHLAAMATTNIVAYHSNDGIARFLFSIVFQIN